MSNDAGGLGRELRKSSTSQSLSASESGNSQSSGASRTPSGAAPKSPLCSSRKPSRSCSPGSNAGSIWEIRYSLFSRLSASPSRFSAASNTAEVTRRPEAFWDLEFPQRGSGLLAAPRPGSYANRGGVSAAAPHPEGGRSAPPAPPSPRAKETEAERLKGSSSAVPAFSPGLRRALASCRRERWPGFGGVPSTESWGQSSFLQSPRP